tara:strand:+ start:21724 stop:22056 length:333 start_codon:yes stop_codon:yes gene_type:complete
MISLFRYPYRHGKLSAVLTNRKLQLLEDGVVVDEIITNDNTLLYDVSVGYSDIPCRVDSKYRTMMFLATDELRTYTLPEVLTALVKNNKIVVESPVIMSSDVTPAELFDY